MRQLTITKQRQYQIYKLAQLIFQAGIFAVKYALLRKRPRDFDQIRLKEIFHGAERNIGWPPDRLARLFIHEDIEGFLQPSTI